MSSAGTASGTPDASRARRSGGSEPDTDRTITAIRDHGTPSCRCARRSRSAAAAAWRPVVAKTSTVTRPASRRPRPVGAVARRVAGPGAGQGGDDAGDGIAQGGAAAVVGAQDDRGEAPRVGVAQQRRVGPAEAEDRGVGVAREHPVVGGGAERAGELDLLGVHVLDVVDDEVAHGGALGLEQVGVGDEGVEHRRDQLGGVERRAPRPAGWPSRPPRAAA